MALFVNKIKDDPELTQKSSNLLAFQLEHGCQSILVRWQAAHHSLPLALFAIVREAGEWDYSDVFD